MTVLPASDFKPAKFREDVVSQGWRGGKESPARRKNREWYGRTVCVGKVRYGSERTAVRRAADQAPSKILAPYRCSWCRGWHLTTAKEEKT